MVVPLLLMTYLALPRADVDITCRRRGWPRGFLLTGLQGDFSLPVFRGISPYRSSGGFLLTGLQEDFSLPVFRGISPYRSSGGFLLTGLQGDFSLPVFRGISPYRSSGGFLLTGLQGGFSLPVFRGISPYRSSGGFLLTGLQGDFSLLVFRGVSPYRSSGGFLLTGLQGDFSLHPGFRYADVVITCRRWEWSGRFLLTPVFVNSRIDVWRYGIFLFYHRQPNAHLVPPFLSMSLLFSC